MNENFTNHRAIATLNSQADYFINIGRKLVDRSSALNGQPAEARFAVEFAAGLLILIGLQLQSVNSLLHIETSNTLAPFSYKELMQMECLS